MDDLRLAQRLIGKETTIEQRSEQANPSSASIVYMVAVTSSSNGEVVLKDEIEANAEWDDEDVIEIDDDGDFEEYESEDDPLEDVDDTVVDMTDGDGVDIEDTEFATVSFSVSDYHQTAMAAYEEENEVVEDDLSDEDAEISDEIDDGDAEILPDVGEVDVDDLAGDATIDDLLDGDYTLQDDMSDDESDDVEGAEISDGYTIAECIGSIKAGDRVAVMIQNGKPTVIGVVGSGDELYANTLAAQAAADEAFEKAEIAETAAGEAVQEALQAVASAENAQQVAENAQAAVDAATSSAAQAQEKADNAKAAVEEVKGSVSSLQTTISNAQKAAEDAHAAAATAQTKADEAAQAAQNAKADADEAKAQIAAAQAAADGAVEKANIAEGTAAQAKSEAELASATAAQAKADTQTLRGDLEEFEEGLETLSNTMETDFAKKTDLTSLQSNLQTQISQNANQISLTAQQVTTIDETANNAAAQAAQAQQTAATAQEQVAAAQADAQAAQTAADQAHAAAAAAQSEADNAKAAATTAQNVANKAETDLEAAKKDLESVSGRVGATETEIQAAQKAVEDAQAAADKAKADATEASQKAQTAQSTANTAITNASNAQSKADEAAQAAADAQDAAEKAQGAATAAQTKADAAAQAAATAQSTADTAKTNAQNAQSKADAAAQAAATAQAAADDADAKAAQAASDLATAKQNLADVTSRVGATEEEVNAAKAAVETAQAAADKAKADAQAAQSTADTAKADAATAQSAADVAKNAADAAQAAADEAQEAADKAQADVNALEIRVTSAETEISNNAEQILLRATKTEVTQTLGGYYTKEQADAAIQVSANNITSTVSSTYATKTELNKKAGDYSIELYNGTGGNPKPVKFATVNYSTCNSENGVSIKIGMVSGHGNGTSYSFLQDVIIRVNHTGGVEVDNTKSYGAETGTYDGEVRHYGDVFWVEDTTNKVVDFYVLMGQYARVYQTPWKRLTYSSGGTVTQYTSCTVYSSGDKVWANNSDIALETEITELSTRITQTEKSITSQATAISEHGTKISKLEQDASGFTLSLEELESDVETAQSTANTVRTEAANAAKTATNYMKFDSSGLCIGDMTASVLGYNTNIKSDRFDIRSGTKILASYRSDAIYLGMDADVASIYLCGDSPETAGAQLWNDGTEDGWNRLCMHSDNAITQTAGGLICHHVASTPDYGQTECMAEVAISTQAPWMDKTEHYPDVALRAVTIDYVLGGEKYSEIVVDDDCINLRTLSSRASQSSIEMLPDQIDFTTGGNINFSSEGVEFNSDIYVANNRAYYGTTTNGTELQLICVNANDNTVIGYGSYSKAIGITNLYGNDIGIYSKGNIACNTNVTVGAKKAYGDGLDGFAFFKDGYMHIQRSGSGNHPYIAFFTEGATDYSSAGGIVRVNQSNKYMEFLQSGRYIFDSHIQINGHMYVGQAYTTAFTISSYWKDGSAHYLVERNADGLTAAFGWAGSSSYATVTRIRGRTCQYQNSSGTTALSDVRLKKDFTELDKWDSFYNALEPCAFRMKNGSSGRFHMGFKAQQVEQALLENELSTQDFAGFIKLKYTPDEDDPEGNATYQEAGINAGDDEFGLIYTEFVALNTYQIQKLKNEVATLKNEIEALKKSIAV